MYQENHLNLNFTYYIVSYVTIIKPVFENCDHLNINTIYLYIYNIKL